MAERTVWEYMTVFVKAEAQAEMDYLQEHWTWKSGVPRNTPESMIPRLDGFGKDGWELVHMQPVLVGNNADVLILEGSGQTRWSSTYFCVFKRPQQPNRV